MRLTTTYKKTKRNKKLIQCIIQKAHELYGEKKMSEGISFARAHRMAQEKNRQMTLSKKVKN